MNFPAFLCSKTEFAKEEAVFSRRIAGFRNYVARAIEGLRNYKMLQNFNESLRPFADKIVQTCAVLVNLQSPITVGALVY